MLTSENVNGITTKCMGEIRYFKLKYFYSHFTMVMFWFNENNNKKVV